MSTLKTTLTLALLLVLNACGAATVTASSRVANGGGAGGASLGPIVDANSPGIAVERAPIDRPVIDRNDTGARESPSFRIEQDCWQCR